VYNLFAEELARELPNGNSVQPTVLKAKKQKVKMHNSKELKILSTRDSKEIFYLTSFDQMDELEEEPTQSHIERYERICAQFFTKDCPAARHFEFAEGAQARATQPLQSSHTCSTDTPTRPALSLHTI
jgi:hypothetical protein